MASIKFKNRLGQWIDLVLDNVTSDSIYQALSAHQGKLLAQGKADKSTTLSGYGILDAYTKSEVDALVSAIFRYKGVKATYAEVEAVQNPQVGDVWFVSADNSEYAWNGTVWEKLGPVIDLSHFITSLSIAGITLDVSNTTITSAQLITALGIYTSSEVDTLLAGKVPTSRKVNGHALDQDITVSKSDVGLGNVDNTSDANKPVSTAQQAALDGKADKVSNPTNGNFAGLDANGNLTDSGKKASDFVASNQGSGNAGKALGINDQGNVVPVPFSGEDFTGATEQDAGTHGYVPAPAAGDQDKFLKGDGTWGDVPDPQTMEGATAQDDGTGGLVPAPSAGDQDKFLKGDGTWGDAPDPTSIIDDTAGDGDTDKVWSADKITDELSEKADKVPSATDGNLAGLDSAGNITDSGIALDDTAGDGDTSKIWSADKTTDELSAKTDKVNSATAGDLAGLDSHGNLTDSGISLDDTAGDGDTNKLWSADKVHDELATKVPTIRKVNGHALSEDVTVTKGDVGLGNVDNTSDIDKPVSTATQTVLNGKADKVESPTNGDFAGLDANGNLTDSGKKPSDFILASEKGSNSGVATLDSSGKVPSSQLPSSVDNVVEGYYYNGSFYEEAAHTTLITPETDKIYIDLATDHSYHWGGSAYARIDDPTEIIDDTAGDGDVDKTWSADKLVDEFSGKLDTSAIDDTAGDGDTDKTWSADKLVDEFNGKLDTDAVDDTAGDGDTDKTWSADKLVDEFNSKLDTTAIDDTAGDGDIDKTWSADKLVDEFNTKADKVTGATENNFAGLDSSGNLKDSGKKASDFIPASEKGANSGVATLDSTGKVPSSQLPSSVDDVVEGYYYGGQFYEEDTHTTLITPESGKIYSDLSSDHTYRWGGTAYVRLDDPEDIIDDTAGAGDTNKVWSADKLTDEFDSVEEDIQTLDEEKSDNIMITDTTASSVKTFTDGADGMPIALKIGIEPVQSGSGDPSPENVRPISGWTGANVYRTGVNVWDEETELGYINPTTGQEEVNTNTIRMKNFVPVLPNTTYRKVTPGDTQFWNIYYDRNKNFISYGNPTKGTFTTPSNCYFIRSGFETAYGTTYNHDISINYPATDMEYHASHVQAYPITFPAGAGTVYGGTLTLNQDGTGTLVVDKIAETYGSLRIIESFEVGTKAVAEVRILNVPSTEVIYNQKHGVIAESLPESESYFGVKRIDEVNYTTFAIASDGTKVAINDIDLTLTQNTYDQKYADFKFVYPLATPVTYTLTAPQVKTMLGVNNIWADTGDVLQIEYYKHNISGYAIGVKVGTNIHVTGDEGIIDISDEIKSTFFDDISFSIQVSDWTAVVGGFKASITNTKFTTNSKVWIFMDDNYEDHALSKFIGTPENGHFDFVTEFKPAGTVTGFIRVVESIPSTDATVALLAQKVSINQGVSNAGKTLMIDSSGNVVPTVYAKKLTAQTLTAGSTTLTFQDNSITDGCTIIPYASVYGIVPSSIVVSNLQAVLTFDPQSSDISVYVEVR